MAQQAELEGITLDDIDVEPKIDSKETFNFEQKPPERKRRGRKPKNTVRKEVETKVYTSLVEVSTVAGMVIGPLTLSDTECHDIARVTGKLAERHTEVAALVNQADDASIYIDTVYVTAKILLRRWALINLGIDIESSGGLQQLVIAMKARKEAEAETFDYATNSPV